MRRYLIASRAAAREAHRRTPHVVPAVAIAAVATLLQLGALVLAPRLASVGGILPGTGHLLDFADEPFLALPRLGAKFVAETWGSMP